MFFSKGYWSSVTRTLTILNPDSCQMLFSARHNLNINKYYIFAQIKQAVGLTTEYGLKTMLVST